MTTQTGIVKWFDEGKGYGFITPDDSGEDLFAHFREIKGDAGFETWSSARAPVQFEVTQGQKGQQALEHPIDLGLGGRAMWLLVQVARGSKYFDPDSRVDDRRAHLRQRRIDDLGALVG